MARIVAILCDGVMRNRGFLPETFPFREPERASTQAAQIILIQFFVKAAQS